MKRQTRWIVAGALVIGAAVGGAGLAVAAASGPAEAPVQSREPDGGETPITGDALDRAKAAALEHTKGGRVTETEVGDEESYYEVEVTLDSGAQVDVQLDQNFKVVGTSSDGTSDEK